MVNQLRQTIFKIMDKSPNIELNKLIRDLWKDDPDINASTIIRRYSEYKQLQKNKKSDIKFPITIPFEKRMIVRDMIRFNVALSFQNFRKYGLSAEEIYLLEKENGWGDSRV